MKPLPKVSKGTRNPFLYADTAQEYVDFLEGLRLMIVNGGKFTPGTPCRLDIEGSGKSGTGTDIVVIAVDDDGNVSAKKGKVVIGELSDYTPPD